MNATGVEVTAGLGGFLVLFGLGLVVWWLGRDLSRRLRRMRQQEELRVARREAPEPPAADRRSEDDGSTPTTPER